MSWQQATDKMIGIYSAASVRSRRMSQKAIVLYLHVHQPYRIRHYTVFDAAVNHELLRCPL